MKQSPLSLEAQPGFAFEYRNATWTFEKFVDGVPYFACEGVVSDLYSAGVEEAAAHAYKTWKEYQRV